MKRSNFIKSLFGLGAVATVAKTEAMDVSSEIKYGIDVPKIRRSYINGQAIPLEVETTVGIDEVLIDFYAEEIPEWPKTYVSWTLYDEEKNIDLHRSVVKLKSWHAEQVGEQGMKYKVRWRLKKRKERINLSRFNHALKHRSPPFLLYTKNYHNEMLTAIQATGLFCIVLAYGAA